MTKLELYNKKRNFIATSEPAGKVEKKSTFNFVVQEHHASHLHYDFRLQLDGVLKSWAVPKGPSEIAGEKRLAVMVEDHPVSYIGFKGTIPEGNYGAGKVLIWDKGNYTPIDEKGEAITESAAIKNLQNGELKFLIKGKKISGSYVLVKMKDQDKNWLIIKHKDSVTVSKNLEERGKKKRLTKLHLQEKG
jgi:bifunctional non-homologous end joining protein LigD